MANKAGRLQPRREDPTLNRQVSPQKPVRAFLLEQEVLAKRIERGAGVIAVEERLVVAAEGPFEAGHDSIGGETRDAWNVNLLVPVVKIGAERRGPELVFDTGSEVPSVGGFAKSGKSAVGGQSLQTAAGRHVVAGSHRRRPAVNRLRAAAKLLVCYLTIEGEFAGIDLAFDAREDVVIAVEIGEVAAVLKDAAKQEAALLPAIDMERDVAG